MPELHVYTDTCDHVVAESLEEALHILKLTFEGVVTDPDNWERLDDTTELSIFLTPSGKVREVGDENGSLVTMTAAEWAQRGKGFLCSFYE